MIDALLHLNGVILNATVSGVGSDLDDLTAAAYLLSEIVNRLGNETVEPAISEVCRYTIDYLQSCIPLYYYLDILVDCKWILGYYSESNGKRI